MFFRKHKKDPFKQAESLSYKLIGAIQNNGNSYEISKSEKTNLNFDGKREVPTIAFRVRSKNVNDEVSYALVFKVKVRDKDEIKFKWEHMPENLDSKIFDYFIFPHSEKLKNND